MMKHRAIAMRSFLFALFFLLGMFVDLPSAMADETKKTVITVGYDEDYGVIDDLESLDNKGFGYEILMRAEHYSDYVFEFVEYDYLDSLVALNAGEIDMVGIILDSEVYTVDYSLVPKPLGSAQLILASRDSNVCYDEPASINGKTVASFENNPYEAYLDAYCEENGIQVTYERGDFYNYTNLDTDYYLVTTLDNNVKDFSMAMNFEVFDMYFATSADNQALANSLADVINLCVSTDGTFLDELQIKYYGNKGLTRRYLTQQELELLTSKTFSCGYIDHHQPIQYTNEDGEPDGVSVEVMNMLAEQYGFEVEYVAYNHDMPYESHENFDILISATGDIEHETAFYTPSEPFMELPIMLFAKSNEVDDILSESHPSNMGILNYITIDHGDIMSRYPNNTVVTYDTFDELMTAFTNGEVDGFFATDTGVEYAQTILGQDEYTIRSTDIVLPLRIFFSNESDNLTEYIGAFNVMFEHIDRNLIDSILSRESVTFFPEYTATEFLKNNFYIIVLISIVVVLVVISIVLYLQFKKKSAILDIVNHDKLTGLISLNYCSDKGFEMLKTAKPGEFEIISLDIDSFHTINAMYSQEKGDKVIIQVAQALRDAFDGTNALITRVIADRFLVMREVGKGVSIKKICEENLATKIREVMGEKYDISMSVGSCVIDDPGKRIDEIIDCAEAARMEGKSKYDYTYYEYNNTIKSKHEMKTNIVYMMQDALREGQFKVVYQPKIRFSNMKIGGAEALSRWHTGGEYGIIPPSVFIDIFEANGFIVNLDLNVFEQVCEFISRKGPDLEIPLISVNLSTITLFDDRFPSEYVKILSKYNLPSSKVELEITESAIALEQDLLVEKLQEIIDLGFSISIDDFGAGESSLNRISSVTAHTIKLDKAFLDNNISADKGAIVVETVINLVKQLNMTVVSEGIETAEQARWLHSLGCDYAQGYYFAKPIPEDDFIRLIDEHKTFEI